MDIGTSPALEIEVENDYGVSAAVKARDSLVKAAEDLEALSDIFVMDQRIEGSSLPWGSLLSIIDKVEDAVVDAAMLVEQTRNVVRLGQGIPAESVVPVPADTLIPVPAPLIDLEDFENDDWAEDSPEDADYFDELYENEEEEE